MNLLRFSGRARLCARTLRRSSLLAEMVALAESSPKQKQPFRSLSTSLVLKKVHKTGKKGGKGVIPDVHPHVQFEEYDKALSDLTKLEQVLHEELVRHFSLKVDLRQYEELQVKLAGSGEVHRLSHLGRISLKNPQMIMINFADRPTAINDAKLALQKSALNVNPQQEGIILYVAVPRMTKERREQLAKDAKQKLLNDYKKAVNDIYVKYDKQSSKSEKEVDRAKSKRTSLLDLKHQFEKRAAIIIEEKQKQLLTEVA